MKRTLMLAFLLIAGLLTNLSWRVPPTTQAQTQATCLKDVAPTTTYGVDKNVALPNGTILKDGDLFLFPANDGVVFTTKDAADFSTSVDPNIIGSNPSYPGAFPLIFRPHNANATSTMISCLDSFWDINFHLIGTGNTAGDKISLYFQQPDGGGKITLAEFIVQPDNQSVRVTAILPGADFSALGHTPTFVGSILPYEEDSGTFGRRTRQITIALPMDGSIPACNQLAFAVTRGAQAGTTSVLLSNIVVNRINTTTANGTGISGTTGHYPTGLKCAATCPACDEIKCDTTICFKPARDWYLEIKDNQDRFSSYMVNLPLDNTVTPVISCEPTTITVQVCIAQPPVCMPGPEVCAPQPCLQGPPVCMPGQQVCTPQPPLCPPGTTDPAMCMPQPDKCVPGPEVCTPGPCTPQPDKCVPGPEGCTPQPDLCTDQQQTVIVCKPNQYVEIALNGNCTAFTSVGQQLAAAYVAAQLSLQEQLPFYWAKIDKQKLLCHLRPVMPMMGMPAPAPVLPAKLSNGKTLDNNSSLQDLLDATDLAFRKGTLDDQAALVKIYERLNNCHKD